MDQYGRAGSRDQDPARVLDYEGNCTSSSGSVCSGLFSIDAGRSAGAAAGARRGAVARAVRFAPPRCVRRRGLAARFVERFAARAALARRAAPFFFDRLDIFLDRLDVFLLDLRDFAALLVLFRRFLAMRVPPGLVPPKLVSCRRAKADEWARVF